MDENTVEFEDYDITVDLNEIDNMDKEEVEECMKKIDEIRKMIDKK